MKEFIEKLIGRLEELYARNDKTKKMAYEEQDWEKFDLFTHRCEGIYSAISIVNQLAEEFAKDTNVSTIDAEELLGNGGMRMEVKVEDRLISENAVMIAVQKALIELGYEPLDERVKGVYEAIENVPTAIEKVKVTSLEIIVTGRKEKPYFQIKYKEVGNDYYNIGYGSYELDMVFGWREECFEVVTNC